MDNPVHLSPPMPFGSRLRFALPTPAFAHEEWWTWCGSVIEVDGRYHLFASRWPRNTPFFNGYLVGSRVVQAVADSPSEPFVYLRDVLPPSGDNRFDAHMTHNPAIIHFQGRYYLFYIGLRYPGPVPELKLPFEAFRAIYRQIRIGVAVADSIDGPFQRQDRPVIDTGVAPWPHFVTTNPAPVITPEGRVRVYYRTPRLEGEHARNVLAVAEADHPLGPYRALLQHPLLPDSCHLEDPFVWWTGDHYQAIAKDLDGNTSGQCGAAVHLYSHDGLHFRLGEPATAYRRELRFADGSVREVGNLERPWVLRDERGKPCMLYAAASDDPRGFMYANRTWLQAIALG